MEKLLCILILAIIAFVLWHLIGRCSCTILNGFRVGGVPEFDMFGFDSDYAVNLSNTPLYNLEDVFSSKVKDIVDNEKSLQHLPLSNLWREIDQLNCMDETGVNAEGGDTIYGTKAETTGYAPFLEGGRSGGDFAEVEGWHLIGKSDTETKDFFLKNINKRLRQCMKKDIMEKDIMALHSILKKYASPLGIDTDDLLDLIGEYLDAAEAVVEKGKDDGEDDDEWDDVELTHTGQPGSRYGL